MLTELAAIAACGLLCGAWVLLDRWIRRRMPGAPGIEERCRGSCGHCPGGESGGR